MNKSKLIAVVIFTMLLLATLVGRAEDTRYKIIPLPVDMKGVWYVTKVHVDRGKSQWNLTRDHQYNFNKFLGRMFTFEGSKLTINSPGEKLCEDLKLRHFNAIVDQVVALTLFSRPFDSDRPASADFGLPLAGNAAVDVYSIQCKSGLLGKDLGGDSDGVGIVGAWMIKVDENNMVMRWYDETILELVKLNENEKPSASYDCTKAVTNVEKTLCSKVSLAAYDKSVAETYKLALKYFKLKKSDNNVKQLKAEQKSWLVKRNTCNTDISCLEKSMAERIDDIDYHMASYGYDNR